MRAWDVEGRDCVWMCEGERESKCGREGVCTCVAVRKCVCAEEIVYMGERERERLCTCVGGERERETTCACEREAVCGEERECERIYIRK